MLDIDTTENVISILREFIPPNITIGVHCTALIVSEISAFIRTDRRTDGQTDRRTWLDRLG